MTTKTHQLLIQAANAGKTLKRSGRDSQRGKVYRSEQVALRPFAVQRTVREVEALVQKIRTSKYVLKNYGDPGHVKVTVTTRRTMTSVARWNTGEIILAAGWGTQDDVVIHEMAHLYASPMGDPGHDWLFCHIYLDLVRKFIGQAEHQALKAQFKANRVRFTPPRKKRQMSPEQKAAASDRMAKARAARHGESVEPTVFLCYSRHFGWSLASSISNTGLKLTQCLYLHGEINPQVLVRKTDKGVGDMMLKFERYGLNTARGCRTIPISKVNVDKFGMVDPDNQPTTW